MVQSMVDLWLPYGPSLDVWSESPALSESDLVGLVEGKHILDTQMRTMVLEYGSQICPQNHPVM